MDHENINVTMSLKDIFKKTDGEAYLTKILELIKHVLAKTERSLAEMRAEHEQVMHGMEGRHKANYGDLKNQVNDVFAGERLKELRGGMLGEMKAEMHEMMMEVMGGVHDSMDEKGGEMDKMMNDMVGKMQVKMDSMKPPELPTEHLELMKEVKAELVKVKEVLANRPQGKAMGRAKVPIFRPVNLTSQQNGIARTFTVAPDTVSIHGGISSQFPFAIEASDITLSGNQITLSDTIAPRETGQSLVIFVESLFYP